MQYILSLLPLLACPVGMGLMIWLMMRGNKQDQAPQRTDQLPTASAYRTPVEATHESPRRNSPLQMLFMMRGMQGGGDQTTQQPAQVRQPSAAEFTRDEQLAELRSRQSGLQQEQEFLARQISEMESPETSIISEAESVARAATQRSAPRQ